MRHGGRIQAYREVFTAAPGIKAGVILTRLSLSTNLWLRVSLGAAVLGMTISFPDAFSIPLSPRTSVAKYQVLQ
jgi:hypothetical protein